MSTVGVAQVDDEEEETLEDGEVIDNEEEEENSEEEENPEEDLPDEKTGVYIGPGTYTPPAGYGGSSGSQVTQGPQAPAPNPADMPDDDEGLDLAPDDEDGSGEPNPSSNVKKTKKNTHGGMEKPEGGSSQGGPAAP